MINSLKKKFDYENMSSKDSDSESVISSSSDENPDLSQNLRLEGEILKNYNIISELGNGAYSIVWLAYDINKKNFCAIKVQNPEDYDDGKSELKILKSLPDHENLLKVYDYFVKEIDNKKFMCFVFDLYCGNIDSFVRKGKYCNGLEINIVKDIFRQLITALNLIHNKCKLIHCDIKTDNILLRGLNDKSKRIIDLYTTENFEKLYSDSKTQYWISQGKDLNNIKKMKQEIKSQIRKNIHQNICNKIISDLKNQEISNNIVDETFIRSPKITIADFGATCEEDEFYKGEFGTRYYRAPEIILKGEFSEKIDIWSAGCILYELIVGDFLFNPDKDKNKSRDYYHLLEISKVCGKFPKKFLKSTRYWKSFFDKELDLKDTEYRSYYDWDDLLENVKDDYNRNQIKDLLKSMLTIDPKSRPSSQEILNHLWLNGD